MLDLQINIWFASVLCCQFFYVNLFNVISCFLFLKFILIHEKNTKIILNNFFFCFEKPAMLNTVDLAPFSIILVFFFNGVSFYDKCVPIIPFYNFLYVISFST
jgi:hypothetical protein